MPEEKQEQKQPGSEPSEPEKGEEIAYGTERPENRPVTNSEDGSEKPQW